GDGRGAEGGAGGRGAAAERGEGHRRGDKHRNGGKEKPDPGGRPPPPPCPPIAEEDTELRRGRARQHVGEGEAFHELRLRQPLPPLLKLRLHHAMIAGPPYAVAPILRKDAKISRIGCHLRYTAGLRRAKLTALPYANRHSAAARARRPRRTTPRR